MQEVQTQLNELQTSTTKRASAEYQEARGRENRLLGLVQQTKAEVDALTARTHQYAQLKSEAENDKKIYEDLETRTRLAGINQQFQNATVQMVAPAMTPNVAAFPRLMINLPLALVLSGILGILAAVFADALNKTFADPEDVANRLHIDVLAAIPAAKRLPSFSVDHELTLSAKFPKRSAEQTACYSEAILSLRSTLNLIMTNRPVRNLLLTSAIPGEGKSTTAAHLAAAWSQLGKRVLLVDADLRGRTVHKIFGIAGTTGLSDVLTGQVPYRTAIVESDQPGLFLMPAGSVLRRSADLISIGFAAVLEKVSREFDLVIVDAPPMLGTSEAQELAATADGVLLVTRANGTDGKLVSEAMAVLSRTRANVIGVVMNQVRPSGLGYPYYYPYSAADDGPIASRMEA